MFPLFCDCYDKNLFSYQRIIPCDTYDNNNDISTDDDYTIVFDVYTYVFNE